MKKNAAPIVAAILLLLPVLYVGSYFALVLPQGRVVWDGSGTRVSFCNYRIDNKVLAERLFWPLERIDRTLRPRAWYRETVPLTTEN